MSRSSPGHRTSRTEHLRPRRAARRLRKPDATIGYRRPAEPVAGYERPSGRAANTTGRRCLCNALLATAGLAQQRPGGYAEPAIVTTGTDYTAVRDLIAHLPSGQRTYTAHDVVTYLPGRPRQTVR